MKRFNLIAVLTLVLSIWSCTDEEYVKPAPQLQIAVISKYLTPIDGANVTLYNTENDLLMKTDPISTLQTDQAGQALFENLEEQRYFFYVEKDGLDNTSDVAATKNAIETGQRFEVVVKIATPIEY
ncbi:SpaA isopeptide-forming pilin-related protein [Maribellus sp. YY47]|uniref:SpaA isopeptide-forming pilin-related protein n=1 Tax=Maribellus sp. YY47 TaxID=2929486 RepID=UPI002000CE10|nr:SpaA isopeptide-forming pilin-related protein [Maribellus sp. YY47]MCK3683261.1 hypothetical protein [Maribellus sp. YY47]